MAADLTVRVLAYAETGAASPHKTDRALENVQQTIREVVAAAGRSPSDVAEDQQWAERFTALPGLTM